jgi:predicted signal transduction protein with EAL and GGDEF domain
VALRLASCVREADTVARLGGDEFVVMLEDLGHDPQEVAHPGQAGRREDPGHAERALPAGGNANTRAPASIGIAPFSGHHESMGELLKQADIAMYQAKAAGRNTLRFFDPGLQAAVTARASLEADMRLALAQDEFFLHYQPQIDRRGHITGVEALMRWKHPQRGRCRRPNSFRWPRRPADPAAADWCCRPPAPCWPAGPMPITPRT